MRTRCWHHIWRWNVFSGKTLFSERGMAKTQLNSPLHASKWGPNWVNSVDFGRKKWRGWCGKPFGIISEHNFFFEKNALFWPPYTCRPSHRPFLCGHSGSEIGLYLALVDTWKARTASKNTFCIRIYSKSIANSVRELDVYITSDVETHFREKRCFLSVVWPKHS